MKPQRTIIVGRVTFGPPDTMDVSIAPGTQKTAKKTVKTVIKVEY